MKHFLLSPLTPSGARCTQGLIVCSCTTLAMDSTRQDFSLTSLGKSLQDLEYAWAGLMCAEILMRIVARGLILPRSAFLRSGGPRQSDGRSGLAGYLPALGAGAYRRRHPDQGPDMQRGDEIGEWVEGVGWWQPRMRGSRSGVWGAQVAAA